MPPDPKLPSSPPPSRRFGEPEKRNWPKLVLFWLAVTAALALIFWMVEINPRQRPLTCRASQGAGLWSAFGRCVED